ncbi:DNA damage-induced apoptosis suppressor protein [Geospiza fortis]|uniref:DNA damage-induced apoptosis suppressor protein n=2 Tax=Thraupidae TaxID=400783 RepID=A0A8N5F4A0_GEOFO|nr:DNA damage-induced apoptosis suppressor protein isoform X1 [Camarhynchus parvulus]XP_030817119.1 DNA damage-induced apoptosis suppressor protein isoform X1 [Camarhynchus parvulus]XP_030921975.1 DNA damage-induced apoptosis suppressor protein [Geospiza fortis]XP_030921976.1 DNA damage-induced apoptosis suppressor protein [Geospiza fortis]XP_030921977.1 DNA damage-induced apoptosis suppressor protein [Geospiza fortis]
MNSVQGLLAASVISIQNSCFIYPACQNCFSRLVLHSRRFNCLKCGCTGEAKDASYRYRLSLKIADTNDLFDITVFGSCLDPFFGVTAENLQRYIQDFNQLSGETNTESTARALVQAVETCFIGKRFIFGVKVCAREDGGHSAASSILQKCSRINRNTKNLVACQIFPPSAAVTGFTVISYLDHLLQLAQFRSCKNSSDLPDASSAPIDEPLSELSSLSSLSRSACSVQSSGRESFLGCWQQSLSLTSSVAWVTAEDFPTLEVGKLVSEQHEQEEKPVSAELGSVSLNNQTLWDSQFLISSVKEGDKEKDNESSSQLSWTDGISATDKLERVSSSNTKCSRGNSSKLLQHPLESEVKNNYPKTNSRNYSYAEKSHNSLVCKRDASTPNYINVAGMSQMDSVFWEELPFSESLNELLARIEDGRSVVTSPSLAGKLVHLESSKLGVSVNKSYSRQAVGDLPAASVSGRLLPAVGNDSWETTVFAFLQSNANSPSDVSQYESSPSDLSSTLKEGGASSPVTPEPSVSQSRCMQSKEANNDVANSSWSFIRLHGETSCSKKSKTATCVHSAWESCLASCENKENYSTPSQKTDLTLTGAQVSDPPAPNNARSIYKRELKPLTELSDNTFRSVSRKELQWNNIFPEGSYNASADLFDASVRDVAKPVEFLNKSCSSSMQEDTLTEKVTAESVLSPGGVPCKSSKLSSSLPTSPHAFSKHSTPVTYSFWDSECSSVCAQDFIPYSQSTPMTKPLQKLWPVGERSSFVTLFTPKNPTKIHSKGKRSRSSFQNTLLQQLTGKLVKRERPRNRKDKESGSSASQKFLNSQLPASLEDWIPPSSNKGLKPTPSLNLKAVSWAADLQSTCGHTGRNPISESRKSSENDANLIQNDRISPGDRARILTTPLSASVTKTLFLNDPVLKTCSPSEGENHLSGGNYSGVVLERPSVWSPELFFQARTPFSKKPKY